MKDAFGKYLTSSEFPPGAREVELKTGFE